MDGEAFDKKLFSITSPEYRLSLASVTFLAGLVSILGNVLVLTAAIRGAIKLDKISVVLIKNISVADLAYALFVILQVGVSLITDGWSFGNVWCHMSTYLELALSAADILLILALNITKLTVILKPFAPRQWTNRTAYVIVSLIWLSSNVYPVIESMFRDVVFDYRSYRCTFLHVAGVWAWSDPLFVVVVVALPTLFIVSSTVCLLFYVNKVSGIHKEAVFTSIWISGIFILSYAPLCTYVLGEKWILHDNDPADLPTDPVYKNLYRVGLFLKFINSMANPFIYYSTILSFNSYVKGLFGKKKFKINGRVIVKPKHPAV